MALDGKLLARAIARLDARREARERARDETERRALAAVPELREIDAEFSKLMGELLSTPAQAGGRSEERLKELERRGTALLDRKAQLLRAHGFDPAQLNEPWYCPLCRDSGYLADGTLCGCLRALYEEEKAKELASLSNSGEWSFSRLDLGLQTGEARAQLETNLRVCREYVATFPDVPNLLFQGGTGLGKSFLSRCVAAGVAERGFSSVYETAQRAFAAFEDQKFSRDAETYAAAGERVRRILGCDLLVLDDLGTEMTTSFTQSALYNIVDTRLEAGLRTILVTNLEDRELTERYIPQAVSRIRGEFDRLPFRGKDVRAQRKEKRYL